MKKFVLDALFECFPSARIKFYTKLNNGNDIQVYRIVFDFIEKSNRSIIIKIVNPAFFSEKHGETMIKFRLEKENYQHLTLLKFNYMPKLIHHKQNFMVFEDLGDSDWGKLGTDEIYNAVSLTLVNLYCSTKSFENLYFIETEKIISESKGEIQYSHQQCSDFLNIGKKSFYNAIKKFSIGVKKINMELEKIERTIISPGPFLSFIHNDLNRPRQTVSKYNKGIYLLDFELGRYGHALLDVAIIMLGKFDWDSKSHKYFLNHQDFSSEFIMIYKRLIERHLSPKIMENWEKEIASALIYTTFVNMGVLSTISSRLPSKYSHEQWLSIICSRLFMLLGCSSVFTSTIQGMGLLSINIREIR